MVCLGPGADLFALIWASSGTDQPCSYSISGHEGSVSLVFRESHLLRRFAVQYAISPPQTNESTTDTNSGRGNGEHLQYQCAAPTKFRLLGWQHDPRDGRYSHEDPLDFGIYSIPPSARQVPEQLSSVAASREQEQELLRDVADTDRVVQQRFIPLSITTSVLIESGCRLSR